MRLIVFLLLFVSCAPKKENAVEAERYLLPSYDHDIEDIDLDDLPEAGDTGE